MSVIGTFEKTDTGWSGTIHTLGLNIKARIEPTRRGANKKAPDHRLFTEEDIEIGAGWSRKSVKGQDYIQMSIDCPTLPEPIYANLVEANPTETSLTESDNSWNLLWSRHTH